MSSVRPLPKELQEIAIKKLRENPETIEDTIKQLREWIEKQEHLKARTDDQRLLNILRGCRYNLERAKKKVEALCAAKINLPQFFENRDPLLPEIQELLKLGLILPLRKPNDPAAPHVTLLHLGNADPYQIPPETAVKYATMIADIVLNEDDNCIVAGGIILADSKGVYPHHTFLASPSMLSTAYEFFRDAYAINPKGAYAINTPGFIEVIYNTCKSILPTFLQNMVHIYSDCNSEELHEAIPLSILPKEYGGEGGTLEELTAEWKAKIESYREWFLEDEKYCLLERDMPEEAESSWFGMNWIMGKLSFE